MSPLKRSAPFILPVGLIICLMVVVMPLPSSVIDLLLAINLAVGVLILLTAVTVKTPLEFSVFPTVLLVTALGRLVLNVATTRLILTDGGTHGNLAAGGMIQGFGQFVAGDHLLVGLIIFAILVIIQFVVITKGAGRISEVSARFALDGMPGRQMAIDADLNAGVIDGLHATQLRKELMQQADFFGAMDGASKYVRGDAIAGVIIIGINLVAGLYLGVVESGMSLTEAVSIFSKLTIGDGLVSQLPAFLIALAAGVLVSRQADAMDLPIQFLQQLLRRPEPLIIAALFLGLLVFARLPLVPLLLVGVALVLLASALRKGDLFADDSAKEPTSQANAAKPSPKSVVKPVEDYLNLDPIEIELGAALLRLADSRRDGDLLERISNLRNAVAARIGLVLPKVRICDNLHLQEHQYRIKLFGEVIANEVAYPLRAMATGSQENQLGLEGIHVNDPVSGERAIWIDPAHGPRASRAGARVVRAVEVIVGHLNQLVQIHANQLLTRDATQALLARVEKVAPAIVNELVPNRLRLAEVQQVLKGLLQYGLSIRNLPAILETLADLDDRMTAQQRVDAVRRRLGHSLASHFASLDGTLNAVTLEPEVENWCESNGTELMHGRGRSEQIMQGLKSSLQVAKSRGVTPIVVVRDSLRAVLQEQLRSFVPDSIVLGRAEVDRFAKLTPVASVDWAAAPT